MCDTLQVLFNLPRFGFPLLKVLHFCILDLAALFYCTKTRVYASLFVQASEKTNIATYSVRALYESYTNAFQALYERYMSVIQPLYERHMRAIRVLNGRSMGARGVFCRRCTSAF